MIDKETYEHFSCIIHKAPKEATHYAVLQYDFTQVYLKNYECAMQTQDKDGSFSFKENLELHGFYSIHDLGDMRAQVSMYQEIESLRVMQSDKDKLTVVYNALFEEVQTMQAQGKSLQQSSAQCFVDFVKGLDMIGGQDKLLFHAALVKFQQHLRPS
jgi:hypothetical protein